MAHYSDGDVKYGAPWNWNIEDKGFVLRPEGQGASDLQMFIPFIDLKGASFVGDFDNEIARKVNFQSLYAAKDHIAAKFKDGKVVEGFTIKSYNPTAPRFLMVPKVVPGKEENSLCILVERKFVEKIKLVTGPAVGQKQA